MRVPIQPIKANLDHSCIMKRHPDFKRLGIARQDWLLDVLEQSVDLIREGAKQLFQSTDISAETQFETVRVACDHRLKISEYLENLTFETDNSFRSHISTGEQAQILRRIISEEQCAIFEKALSSQRNRVVCSLKRGFIDQLKERLSSLTGSAGAVWNLRLFHQMRRTRTDSTERVDAWIEGLRAQHNPDVVSALVAERGAIVEATRRAITATAPALPVVVGKPPLILSTT